MEAIFFTNPKFAQARRSVVRAASQTKIALFLQACGFDPSSFHTPNFLLNLHALL